MTAVLSLPFLLTPGVGDLAALVYEHAENVEMSGSL